MTAEKGGPTDVIIKVNQTRACHAEHPPPSLCYFFFSHLQGPEHRLFFLNDIVTMTNSEVENPDMLVPGFCQPEWPDTGTRSGIEINGGN